MCCGIGWRSRKKTRIHISSLLMNVDSGPNANDDISRFSLCFGLFHEFMSQAPIHRSTPYSIVSAHSRVKEDSDRYQSGSYIDLPIFRVGCYVLPFWLRVCNICWPDLNLTRGVMRKCYHKQMSYGAEWRLTCSPQSGCPRAIHSNLLLK